MQASLRANLVGWCDLGAVESSYRCETVIIVT